MEEAAQLLGVPLNASPTVIKRAYYKKALLTHPDKNAAPEAADQFRRLQEAYAMLCEGTSKKENEKAKEEAWFDTSAMLDLLANAVSEETLLAMYKFLMEYKDFIPEHQYLIALIESKLTRPHIVVEPTLQNLFDQQVFIYSHDNGKKYSIPLWHHTLFFDDLIAVCAPKSDNPDVWVDEHNHIHASVDASAKVLLAHGSMGFNVGPKNFTIPSADLRLTPTQTHVLRNQGIPLPDPENILSVVQLSDVFVHVHLTA